MTTITNRNESDTRGSYEDMLTSALRNIKINAKDAIELASNNADNEAVKRFNALAGHRVRLIDLFGVNNERGGYVLSSKIPDDELKKSMETIVRPNRDMVTYIMETKKKK